MSIIITNVTKQYGHQKAVDNLSFTAHPGDVVGFLGPNGAGKSTTLKILVGSLKPTQGSTAICGLSVQKNSVAVKKLIGYLPEDNPLYTNLFVQEYLSFIAAAHQLKNSKRTVASVMEQTGLLPVYNKKINQLSKGFKQRVGLAAALIHKPPVLILDEPTSGLDPNQIIEIRQLIKEYGKTNTVLFSSHILQEVETICTRILIIHQGQLKINQPTADLINQSHTRLRVSFSEPLTVSFFDEVASCFDKIEQLPNSWVFSTKTVQVLKPRLMALCVERSITIDQLEILPTSLEEIFKQSTQ